MCNALSRTPMNAELDTNGGTVSDRDVILGVSCRQRRSSFTATSGTVPKSRRSHVTANPTSGLRLAAKVKSESSILDEMVTVFYESSEKTCDSDGQRRLTRSGTSSASFKLVNNPHRVWEYEEKTYLSRNAASRFKHNGRSVKTRYSDRGRSVRLSWL